MLLREASLIPNTPMQQQCLQHGLALLSYFTGSLLPNISQVLNSNYAKTCCLRMFLQRPLFGPCNFNAANCYAQQSCHCARCNCCHCTHCYCTVPTLSHGHVISTCRSYRAGTAATRRADALLRTALCVLWHKVGIQQQLLPW